MRYTIPSRDSARLSPFGGCECGNASALRKSVARKADPENKRRSIL